MRACVGAGSYVRSLDALSCAICRTDGQEQMLSGMISKFRKGSTSTNGKDRALLDTVVSAIDTAVTV